MKREIRRVRDGWESRLVGAGMNYAVMFGWPYWKETAAYVFSGEEIDKLADATRELHGMCLDVAEDIIKRGDYHLFGLSKEAAELVHRSWFKENASLYGRFDLVYDGKEIKMLEYNADTPTALLEAAVCQWHWLEDNNLPDQFNSIHEKLIERWSTWKGAEIYFTMMEQNSAPDDHATVNYLIDTATQGGIKCKYVPIERMGWDGSHFIDDALNEIEHCFKLYPWEWMLKDQFGKYSHACQWFEPAWKMLLSNKALLVELWKRHKDHPLLLETHLKDTPESVNLTGGWVQKPFLSREGCNVIVLENGVETLRSKDFKDEYKGLSILQQRFNLPNFDGFYPVLGSWVIGNEPAGIGIREDESFITTFTNSFVPHYFT